MQAGGRTDKELVDAARTGDQPGWDELVARHGSRVWAVARAHRLSSADAEDVFQLTFMRLVTNIDRIRDPARIGAWLATTARHESADSTWEQRYWGHTYKAGYESVISDNSFVEVRAGQFKYEWPNFRYTEAPAYQDLATSVVSGGNRDGWFNIPSRNQAAGSVTYFRDGWLGSHNFKAGGEWFRETFTFERGVGVDGVVPGDVLHVPRGVIHAYINQGPEVGVAIVSYSPAPGPDDRVLIKDRSRE